MGANEIIHNLLAMETNHNNTEMQETSFTNETTRLINNDNRFIINSETSSQYGSDMSEVLLNNDTALLNWDYNHMNL